MISRQKKAKAVERIREELKKSETIAVGSIAGLPSRQFNAIKKKTRGQAKIVFARQTLLKRALEEARPEALELAKFFCNGAVLVLSDLNAFKLHRLFKQNKTRSFAKPGALAPSDIIVPAGETNLAPGPVLTELKQAKIEAKIIGPRVVIARDAVVTRKGETVSEPVARILAKLGIEPVEVGVEIKAAFEKGTLYEGGVLDVDEALVFKQFTEARQQAINLAVFARIFNEVSTPIIIARATQEAMALESIIKQKSGAQAPSAMELTTTPAEPAAKPAAEPPTTQSQSPEVQTTPKALEKT